MYVARDKDGTLKLFECRPYLHINEKERVEIGRDEIGHDVFIEVYGPGKKVLQPFWAENCSIVDDVYSRHPYKDGKKINKKLFPEVTFENSPYDLETMQFASEDDADKYIIIH